MSKPPCLVKSLNSSSHGTKMLDLSQALETKAEAFEWAAKKAKEASRALKEATKIDEECKQLEGGKVSDLDFDKLIYLVTRLNGLQREKLLNALQSMACQHQEDEATTYSDEDIDATERSSPQSKKTLGESRVKKANPAPIPPQLPPLEHE